MSTIGALRMEIAGLQGFIIGVQLGLEYYEDSRLKTRMVVVFDDLDKKAKNLTKLLARLEDDR